MSNHGIKKDDENNIDNHSGGRSHITIPAARHLCEEARIVLTSLRGGPPHVARGDMAQDLLDIRDAVQRRGWDHYGLVSMSPSSSFPTHQPLLPVSLIVPQGGVVSSTDRDVLVNSKDAVVVTEQDGDDHGDDSGDDNDDDDDDDDDITSTDEDNDNEPPPAIAAALTRDVPSAGRVMDENPVQDVVAPPPPPPTDGGPYARPFLQVIMDPRAAGPYTFVALRALYRLIQRNSLGYFVNEPSSLSSSSHGSSSSRVEPNRAVAELEGKEQQPDRGPTAAADARDLRYVEDLTKGILSCRFEQTDPAADEAVEMALADVLRLLVQKHGNRMRAAVVMDAFHTVFVTRNTFVVQSPALCNHFEDALAAMVTTMFAHRHAASSKALLQFITHQLLHTPLVGGDGLDEATREAQMTHDATRVLCLRLTRIALQHGWSSDDDKAANDHDHPDEWIAETTTTTMNPNNCSTQKGNEGHRSNPQASNSMETSTILQIIQDDLCLSLLMTGQAIWAYHDAHSNISPGFVSLEVLAEICVTIVTLWNILPLRTMLIVQFETIFTGFYTRALVLLRKRKEASNSVSYNANLTFDAEVEIILESLVDILCLHDHSKSIADGDGGSLETMFVLYDCHMFRSDAAVGLMMELCRCCGGQFNEDGEAVVTTRSNSSTSGGATIAESVPIDSGPLDGLSDVALLADTDPVGSAMMGLLVDDSDGDVTGAVRVEHPWRPAPAHLRELCAQALMGGMRCLFSDDKASDETIVERSKRSRSIMLRQIIVDAAKIAADDQGTGSYDGTDAASSTAPPPPSSHQLRDVKSRKRLMRRAASIFNRKASRGISFLVDAGLVPDPATPESVATFLRNGIVVGLDKKAAGAYLGEAGKAPVAGKSPPNWERDWFHKDVLRIYCSLFSFENQSLLDGLRMFLAAFRLPGEAQQIDRILQAFADSCGRVCEEAPTGRLRLFSEDPKRASDAAYLLSFSIIMLNTDLHNENIREDRKMSPDDFVKNNTDYGRDITEKGKEFPREYLLGIYESIREEPIRTEAEGADGAMTVERWKDVMRGSSRGSPASEMHLSLNDAEDLTELILEHVWKPIMSSIGGLLGVARSTSLAELRALPSESGMFGAQGARLGMDMSLEMLDGVRKLGRVDIFRKIYAWVCDYTGLVGHNKSDIVEKTWALTNSVEAQSAVIVSLTTAAEYGEYLDEDGWRRFWCILFELRDLKLIPGGRLGLLHESDPDILTEGARRDWSMCLMKGDMEFDARAAVMQSRPAKASSMFGAFGRALFGSDASHRRGEKENPEKDITSGHGKDALVVWDEVAPSDDEMEDFAAPLEEFLSLTAESASPGARFENLLIRESRNLSQVDMPVTGLERVDETRRHQVSPRARVRERFRVCCTIESLISGSRFMDDASLDCMLRSLVAMASSGADSTTKFELPPSKQQQPLERSPSSASSSTASFIAIPWHVPVSPASEAFAEVLICELALKNKDRLRTLWDDVLQDHYLSRLASMLASKTEGFNATKPPVDPGLEKRISGLLRLSVCAIQRKEVANDILSSWKYFLPMNAEQHAASPLRILDRHMGEGMWRIVAQVDALSNLDSDGWEGIIALLNWCAVRGAALKPIASPGMPVGQSLGEDDPALQCYRCLHVLLNTCDLEGQLPCSVTTSLRSLVMAGEKRRYPQLSIAALDLLSSLIEKKLAKACHGSESEPFWNSCWSFAVESIADGVERSSNASVRQYSLSMLTDIFLDKQGSLIPTPHLCKALSEICVPVAGRRVVHLLTAEDTARNSDELMIEFELCIGLIFKPLRHHIGRVVSSGSGLSTLWAAVLFVVEEILGSKSSEGSMPHGDTAIPDRIRGTMTELAIEHLQNAILTMISNQILRDDSESPDDITSLTWAAVTRMGIEDAKLNEWKMAASKGQQRR